MAKVIVALSGGKSSFWCADYAIKKYGKSNVVLYFNDTKWEHPDLYRFLRDISDYFSKEIVEDSDGRSPEDLFIQNHALANNRMPFCSRILKAERLQDYFQDGDILVFGIGTGEEQRALRLGFAYQKVCLKKKKQCKIETPVLSNNVSSDEIDRFLRTTGIDEPELYKLGFTHNNCSGGCVRAGKKQWALLYDKLPSVYRERERVEELLRKQTGKDIHFLKDETLNHLRERIERGEFASCF